MYTLLPPQWEIWLPFSLIYFFDQFPCMLSFPSPTPTQTLIIQLGCLLPKPEPSPSTPPTGVLPLCWVAPEVDALFTPLRSWHPILGYCLHPHSKLALPASNKSLRTVLFRKKRKGKRKNIWPYFMHLNISVLSFFKKYIYLFIWLCRVSVATRGIFVAACEMFVAACRIFSCGMWTLSCGMHVGSSSLTRERTWAPCIGRGVLATGPPGKSLSASFYGF